MSDLTPKEERALAERLFQQAKGTSERKYPQGRLGGDDDGEIAMACYVDEKNKVVRLDFMKPITWLGLPKKEALALANALLSKANELP